MFVTQQNAVLPFLTASARGRVAQYDNRTAAPHRILALITGAGSRGPPLYPGPPTRQLQGWPVWGGSPGHAWQGARMAASFICKFVWCGAINLGIPMKMLISQRGIFWHSASPPARWGLPCMFPRHVAGSGNRHTSLMYYEGEMKSSDWLFDCW